MRVPALQALGILILGCSIPLFAHAWGDAGHRVVGLIAEHYLDPGVRTQVDTLLGGDTSGLVPGTDIADEATWADKYRDSDRNSTKVHYNATHNWHFVDIEISSPDIDAACFQHPAVPIGTLASEAGPNDCVVDKIDQFAKELADPSIAVNERRMALEFLLHFVGDLHQPLHASDSHDQGGNAKKVTGCSGSANLHSCWDTPMVTKLGIDDASIANALIAQITPALLAQWRAGTSADWAQEAFQLAKTETYGKLPALGPNGAYALDATYLANGQQVVREQLSRAGVRLAMVLNRALAAGGSTGGGGTGGGGGGGTTGGSGHGELLGNPGFENGSQPAPWTATAGVISDNPSEPAHGGHWTAWLDGYGTRTTDTLYQTVTLPGSSPATLSFWLHIDTDETTTTQIKGSLKVQVLSTIGKILATLATYSNLDAAPGYAQKSFDLGAYQGQRIKIRFTGSEDGSKQTSFVIDDASIQ